MSNDKPLISIIVPTYNTENYIENCIESILSQTYDNIQIIIVDDGSIDRTRDICDSYSKDNQRGNNIIVIHSENKGVSSARNIGLSKANGDYIGFVDSDDYIEPDMYATMLTIIEDTKSEICALSQYTIRKYRFLKSKNYKEIDSKWALKLILTLKFPTSVWAYLYSRDAIKTERFDPDIHFFEDIDFNIRVLSNVKKVSVCHKYLYHYNNQSDYVSKNRKGAISERKMSCLKVLDKLENNQILKSFYKDEVTFLKLHFIYSLLLSLAKSEVLVDEYFNLIKSYSKNVSLNLNNIPSFTIRNISGICLTKLPARLFHKVFRLVMSLHV